MIVTRTSRSRWCPSLFTQSDRNRIKAGACVLAMLAGGVVSAATSKPLDGPSISVRDVPVANIADGIIAPIDLPTLPGQRSMVTLPTADFGDIALELNPVSLRAAGYKLLEQIADGSIREVADPGIEKTYEGIVLSDSPELKGATVAASLLENGLFAKITFEDGRSIWVEPWSEHLPGAPEGWHVIYRGGDTDCEGRCGTEEANHTIRHQVNHYGGRGGCGGSVCVAQIALDADFEYFTARGSNTFAAQDRMMAIINVVNHQYRRDVAIRHEVTNVIVRTAEPDPYTATNPNTLLDQMTAHWRANHSGITCDVAHLFTGKNIDGSTIGIAWIGVICNNNFKYGLSQSDFSSSFACQTDLTAHELGHNWGAGHCTCSASTMNASITCANTFFGTGSSSASEIDAHADGVGCLTGGTTPPANDLCTGAIEITRDGAWFGNNANAGTDGGTVGCGSTGGGTRDVWWRLTPPENGTVVLDTCGSSFDTQLAVFTGCPGGLNNLVVCNDDATIPGCAATALRSRVTFAAVRNAVYFIRVSGFGSNSGDIQLNVDAPGGSTNTLCSGAIQIAPGQTLLGTLYGASFEADAPTCGGSATNPDVWYQFTAPCAGTLVVDTCGSNDNPGVDMGTDTVLSLHTGCPGTATNQITCVDDFAGCPGAQGANFDSRVSATLTAGQNVKIRVSHFGTSGFNSGTFNIRADFAFSPIAPVVNTIANTVRNCGSAFSVDADVSNPACMTGVTFSLVTAPAGATINAASGIVSWPNPTIGTHSFTVRATNSAGFDDEPFTLTVNRLAPVIVDIPNTSRPCSLGAYTGPAPALTNPGCMNPITAYSIVSAPAGMTINPSTGIVSWPSPVVGTHTITIRGTNSAGFDDESWTLTIAPTAPTINDVPNATHACGGAYTGPSPSMAESTCTGTLSWSLVTGPAGMTINSSTGIVTWPVPVVGTHAITIRAANSTGFDDEGWTLTVNQAVPVINDIANITIPCSTSAYTGPTPGLANAPCAGAVTWSLRSGPAGMTINATTGIVSWPSPIAGTHNIVIRAIGAAGFADEAFALTLPRLVPVLNDVPDAVLSCITSYTGPAPTLTNPACMSPITTYSLVSGPAGMTINATTGIVSWPVPVVGTHVITIRATNSAGFDDEAWSVTVNSVAVRITTQPVSLARTVGQSATFSIAATGNPAATYRWRKNGVNLLNGGNISGVTTPNLVINPVGNGDAANYDCIVTNSCGSVNSIAVSLAVRCPSDLDDGSGTGSPDGGVTIDDLLYFLNVYGNGVPAADLDDGSGSGTPDGGVTIEDLLFFLFRYEGGC